MIPEWWPAIVFGWPAVGASLTAFAMAFITGRTLLAAIGTALAAPFCLFASGYPGFGLWGAVALAANIGSVVAVRSDRPVIAAMLLVPFVVIGGRVALAVGSQ